MELRTEAHMNVVVGNHRPPPGGPEIAIELSKLIRQAIDNDATTADAAGWNLLSLKSYLSDRVV